jgi:hypothetical protein
MNGYTFFYEEDMSSCWKDWAEILDWLKLDFVSADDVWEIAREWKNPPHLGNIYTDITLSRIQSWCEDRGIDCDYHINAICSSFHIDGYLICSLDDFINHIPQKVA